MWKFKNWYEKLFLLIEVQDHQHRSIENSDAVNMVKSRIFFPKPVTDPAWVQWVQLNPRGSRVKTEK